MAEKKDKDAKPQRLSGAVEQAPHIDRRATIVSTFLEHGEDKDLSKGEYDELQRQRRHVYGRSKSWLEYWDDRQSIYRAKKKEEPVHYDPPAFEKLVGLLAYLPLFVFFLPIVMSVVYKGKDKPAFMTFHIKQGLNLLLGSFFMSIVFFLTIFLIHNYVPNASTAFYAALSLIWVLPFWLMITGISNASRGKWKRLPLIGKDMIAD